MMRGEALEGRRSQEGKRKICAKTALMESYGLAKIGNFSLS